MNREMILHDKVKEFIGNEKVLGFVTGFYQSRGPGDTLIVTENAVLIYKPRLTGTTKLRIPFFQVLGASYWREGRTPHLSVTTQSGTYELNLSGLIDTREPALRILTLIRDVLTQILGLPVSESHQKHLLTETWSLDIPSQISIIRPQTAGPDEHTSAASLGSKSIADELAKLAALRDSGVLSQREFSEAKKRLLQ